jgi:hypothetical protein
MKKVSNFLKKQFKLVLLGIIFLSIPITLINITKTRDPRGFAEGPNITVDFTRNVRNLSPLVFGMDSSAYGWTGSTSRTIANDTQQQQKIKDLKIAQMRITLGYQTPGDQNSRIICYAEGCGVSTDVHTWIQGIRAAGAEPLVQVQMNTGEEVFWTTDAGNMVRFLNITHKYNIKRWVVDNEPDNHGMSATTYSNGFNQVYDAMKAVDPTIKVGGPTTAWYNRAFIDTFLQISGSRVDFVDYHNYGMGGSNIRTDQQLLSETVKYENDPRDLRALIRARVPGRAEQIEIELGEWNMSWTGEPRMLTHLNTLWSASVIGHAITEGVLLRQYADKNGSLGALCQTNNQTQSGTTYSCAVNDPLPVYHGLGMFTGENLFRKFGEILISSSTNLSNIEVFASDNPKNIVVINKSQSNAETGEFSLNGIVSGTATIWRKGPNETTPVNVGSVEIRNSSFAYSLQPYTIYTILVEPGGSTSKLGDLNGDDEVDSGDLSILISNWGSNNANVDINSDGVVNSNDLAILISRWGS